MSEFLLSLSSDNLTGTDTSSDFTTKFNRLALNGNYKIGLESLNVWYSLYNISSSYNNNKLRYNNGVTNKTITIVDGLYSIDDLQTYLESQFIANGDYTAGTPNVFYINFAPNYNTFRCRLTISGGYSVDFSNPSTYGYLHTLLGFNPAVYNDTTEGQKPVNITSSNDSIQLHCDIITGSFVNGSKSDVLYQFQFTVAPSSLQEIKPNKILYLPIKYTSGFLDRIRLYFTNQSGTPIDFNGERVSVLLSLMPA